jgi:uncharacterized protein (DUF1810 family)
MPPSDPFGLNRFVDAQANGVYEEAFGEIQRGRKRSHWMWFVFPQFDGLGFSATSKHYAIKSIEEARAYLAHPILGPRLIDCAASLLQQKGSDALAIFGSPDDMKLLSSATLFAQISPPDSVFHQVIDKYFGGRSDERTIKLLTRG